MINELDAERSHLADRIEDLKEGRRLVSDLHRQMNRASASLERGRRQVQSTKDHVRACSSADPLHTGDFVRVVVEGC